MAILLCAIIVLVWMFLSGIVIGCYMEFREEEKDKKEIFFGTYFSIILELIFTIFATMVIINIKF